MNNNSFCAFLRDVNVKGTSMKMVEVCSVFEEVGMENVSSVLATGNILFTSNDSKEVLKELIEKAISAHFSYDAFLFLKEKNDVEEIINNNPFETDEEFHIYGFVGVDGIEKTLMYEFEKCGKTIGEEAKITADNFYWKVPKGNMLGSDFGKILGRKSLKDSFTSRNLNTFEKVLKKM